MRYYLITLLLAACVTAQAKRPAKDVADAGTSADAGVAELRYAEGGKATCIAVYTPDGGVIYKGEDPMCGDIVRLRRAGYRLIAIPFDGGVPW